LPFDRSRALLLKAQIIDKINADTQKRKKLKSTLLQLSQIAESTPKDIAGEDIPTPQLEASWGKIKSKAEALLV